MKNCAYLHLNNRLLNWHGYSVYCRYTNHLLQNYVESLFSCPRCFEMICPTPSFMHRYESWARLTLKLFLSPDISINATLKNNHKSLDTSPHSCTSLSDMLWWRLGLWNWPVYCIGVNQGARYTWASVEEWRGAQLKAVTSRHIALNNVTRHARVTASSQHAPFFVTSLVSHTPVSCRFRIFLALWHRLRNWTDCVV